MISNYLFRSCIIFGIIIKEKYSTFNQGIIQQSIMSINKVIRSMTELSDPPSYSPFLHYQLVSSFQKSILEIQVTRTALTFESKLRSGWFWLPVFPISLWHNSLIRISTFREFRSQQFHEGHNLFANCRWKHGGDSLFTRFSVL